jgi:hypothetical protein
MPSRSQRHKLETHAARYKPPTAAVAGGWSVADAAPAGAVTVTVNAAAFPDVRSEYPVTQVGLYVNDVKRGVGAFPGPTNITGLTPSVQVAVKITPINEAGEGPISASKNVTPV